VIRVRLNLYSRVRHDFELKQATTETDAQIQVRFRSCWRCIKTQIGHHGVQRSCLVCGMRDSIVELVSRLVLSARPLLESLNRVHQVGRLRAAITNGLLQVLHGMVAQMLDHTPELSFGIKRCCELLA
jgi:hypothetical protein